MDCPHCRLVNPPEAVRCDCGYDFIAGIVKDRYRHTQGIAQAAAARRRCAMLADVADNIDCGLDIGDAADPSEVWDNCDLLGCPPGCDGLH